MVGKVRSMDYRDYSLHICRKLERKRPFEIRGKKKKGKGHPCTGTEALYNAYGPWGSRGIALLFHGDGTRKG